MCNGNPVKHSQNIIQQRCIIWRKLRQSGNFFEQPRAIFRYHRVNQVINFLMINRPEHGFYRTIPNFVAPKRDRLVSQAQRIPHAAISRMT